MNELLKRGFYLGLGAAIAGKEKAEKYVNDLVKKGELAPSEAKNLLDELAEKGREKQEVWGENFRTDLKDSLKMLGLITKEEHEELENRLKSLEAKLEELNHKAE